jgi:hypothetical protein
MKTEEDVLYTDGHDVTITYSAIQVKRKWYRLNGITKHGFSILAPARLPYVLLLMVGTTLSIIGLVDAGSSITGISQFTLFSVEVQLNHFLFWLGISLLATAAVLMVIIPDRYAVSITTAEGEKNVIVSTQKEYITQIIKALNEAFLARVASTQGLARKKRKLMTS